MIKALIFDLDGTIADTEEAHFLAYRETLATYGIKITKHDFIHKWLKGDASAIKGVLKNWHKNSEKTKKEARRKKEKLYLKMISQTKIKALPGAKALIRKAKKSGLKVALASGSTQKEIKKVLKDLKIHDKFDLILGLDNIRRNKPAPEMFLLAAKKLRLKPEEILVIENAPNGLNGAKEAGMKCIVIPSSWTKELKYQSADLILKSLEEVTIDMVHKFGGYFDKSTYPH